MPRDAQRYRKTYSYFRPQPRTDTLEILVDETLDWKNSVRAASTADVSLSGAGTTLSFSGLTLVNEDRVLLKDQSTASQNGIYYFEVDGDTSTYVFSRASDANTNTLTTGAATYVEAGTNGGKIYILSTTMPINVGSTSLTWTEFSSGGGGSSSPTFWLSTTATSIYTTGSVAIKGDLVGVDSAADIGSDVFFFVSGSKTGSGLNNKKAVFGGDVVMSGSLEVSGDQVEITGSLRVTNGISGSLTKLTDGTSYLIAGPNITINTGSNGAVQITGSAGGLGGSGTNTYLAKFTPDGSTLGNSLLSESGLTITSEASNLSFTVAQTWSLPDNASALDIRRSGGDTVLKLDSNGYYVGIGTSPQSPLHVALFGSSTTSDAFENATARTITMQNTSSTDGNSATLINFNNSNEPNGYIRFINTNNTFHRGAISFGTSNGTSDRGERMRIDEVGRVGIGTSDIAAVGTDVFLFVSGSSGSLGTATRGVSAFGGDVIVSGSLKIGTGSVLLTSNDIQFGTSGMRIQKNGNDMKFFDITNPSGYTLTDLAAGGGGGGSSPVYWTSPSAGSIYATGSVGIGTNTYTGRLYVSGSSTGTTPTLVARHGVANGSSLPVLSVENSAGNSLLFVSGSGFVGIGTSTQSVYADQTIGTGATTVSIASSGAGEFPGAVVLFEVDNTLSGAILVSNAGMNIAAGANRELSLSTDNSTAVIITPEGLVQIVRTDSYFDATLNSGQGIKLADTPGNAGAQVLDCYSEKTVNNIRFYSSGDAGVVMEAGYTTVSMTRIGRMVTVAGHIKATTAGKPTASGRLSIDLSNTAEIPLPAKKTAVSLWITSFESGLMDPVMGYLDTSDVFIYIDRFSAGSVVQDLADFLDTGSEAIFSVTYSV